MDWEEVLWEEEERKEQDKEEYNFSVCSDWDADLEEWDRNNQEIEDHKNNDRKTPQPSLKLSLVDTFTPKPFKPSTEQLDNQSSLSPETENKKIDTLATLLGHENTETLENIN